MAPVLLRLLVQAGALASASFTNDDGPGKVMKQAQNYHDTGTARYPRIMSKMQALLGKADKPRILSFGCSNGDEVRTIRKMLPNAVVDRVDIDKDLIADNSKKNKDKMVHYYDSVKGLTAQSYDAVMAFGVLLRQLDYEDDHLPYKTYEYLMNTIDRYTKPNGYLIIYNSNFPFADASVAKKYTNLAQKVGCTKKNGTILSTDRLYNKKSAKDLKSGMCVSDNAVADKSGYCIESGWIQKFSKKGVLVQKKRRFGKHSHGCSFPGTFFKKKVSTAKDALISQAQEAIDVLKTETDDGELNLVCKKGAKELEDMYQTALQD